MRILMYVLWIYFWWSLPLWCLALGGRFVNFIMTLIVVAITTSIAGFLALWPRGAWRDEGVELD